VKCKDYYYFFVWLVAKFVKVHPFRKNTIGNKKGDSKLEIKKNAIQSNYVAFTSQAKYTYRPFTVAGEFSSNFMGRDCCVVSVPDPYDR
jgi:hypothetical protein